MQTRSRRGGTNLRLQERCFKRRSSATRIRHQTVRYLSLISLLTKSYMAGQLKTIQPTTLSSHGFGLKTSCGTFLSRKTTRASSIRQLALRTFKSNIERRPKHFQASIIGQIFVSYSKTRRTSAKLRTICVDGMVPSVACRKTGISLPSTTRLRKEDIQSDQSARSVENSAAHTSFITARQKVSQLTMHLYRTWRKSKTGSHYRARTFRIFLRFPVRSTNSSTSTTRQKRKKWVTSWTLKIWYLIMQTRTIRR